MESSPFATLEKIKKFIMLLDEEAKAKKAPLELSNGSDVITFIISMINDIMVYNVSGDRYHSVMMSLERNLPKHPTLSFIGTLDYLSKPSERLHILLFLEFSRKTIDIFFERMRENRNIMLFFAQEKNVYFTGYLQFLIDLLKLFKEINYVVRSVVLDQYHAFLRSASLKTTDRSIKRASTPDMILGILDSRYQWKINTKNLSVSPARIEGPRPFFIDNVYHKKKNSSFEAKVNNKGKAVPKSMGSNTSLRVTSFHQLGRTLSKHKSLLNSIKQTNELFRQINQNITQEINDLHSTLAVRLQEHHSDVLLTDAGQQKKEDQKNSIKSPKPPRDSKLERIPISSKESLEDEQFAQEQPESHHTKKSSRINKLSFGQKSLSHEKLDSMLSMSGVSPKFDGNETNKSFSGQAVHMTGSDFSALAKRYMTEKSLMSPQVIESDTSYYEENKQKHSHMLFKERFDSLSLRFYKAKPPTKKTVKLIRN